LVIFLALPGLKRRECFSDLLPTAFATPSRWALLVKENHRQRQSQGAAIQQVVSAMKERVDFHFNWMTPDYERSITQSGLRPSQCIVHQLLINILSSNTFLSCFNLTAA